MKKVVLTLGFLPILVVLCACSNTDDFRGSGNIISQNREVTGFTRIDNSTSINISISKSMVQEVQVSADDNIINEVQTTIESGVLKVGLADGNYIDITVNVVIGILNIEGIENTGSGNISVSGFEDLPNLAIDNEGSGNITMNGSGNTLSIKNSGSGNYKGFGFTVSDCSITNSGSGNCEINCTDVLSGLNSGSGNVFYKGTPTVNITNTGSGGVVDSN